MTDTDLLDETLLPVPGTATPTATPPEEAADLSTPAPVETATPPLPAELWDAETGTIRAERLVQSYLELQDRVAQMLPCPEGPEDRAARERLLAALGRPGSAEEYRITPPHALVEPEPALNARLHEAGFTQEQAQLVYDLAAERLVPAVQELVDELAAQRESERLAERFGGPEAWRETARQIKAWGEANLEPGVLATLSTSYDGVLALHQMMRRTEPAILGLSDGAPGALDEPALHEMMRDRRYWRDRDPEFIARVTEGFKRLFSG